MKQRGRKERGTEGIKETFFKKWDQVFKRMIDEEAQKNTAYKREVVYEERR